jgi:DNA-binding FadR family transcriptional regulator
MQLNRASLVDETVRALRGEIATGRWSVGARIPPEPALADLLKVSRGTVREAVRVLAAAGLLEVRQGSGTYVRSQADGSGMVQRLGLASLKDRLEVRCMLESEAARLAAPRCQPDHVGELNRLLDARDAAPPQDFVERDLAFHRHLVALSGNSALEALYEWFSASVAETIAETRKPWMPEPDRPQHDAIVAALAVHDADAAVAAVKSMIAPLLARLTRALETPPDTQN